MESVLFCSKYYPCDVPFGSATRMERVLRWFQEQAIPVHFLHMVRRSTGRRPPAELAPLVASHQQLALAGENARASHPQQWKDLTRPRRHLVNRLWSRAWDSPPRTQIEEILRRTGATILWIDHTYLAPLAALVPESRRLLRVVDTHDVLHLRDASFHAGGLPPKCQISRDEESQLLSAFDMVVAIQEEEQQSLAQMLPRTRVIQIGHAVDLAPQPCTGSDICFVGSQYVVNEDSLLHFLQEAWPAIRASCAGTNLQVVGGVSHSPAVVAAAARDERIVLRGIVPHVRDIYAGPAVVICPLAVGSGLKIKMVEALAHGKAVVGTPIAAQGLAGGINTAFLVAPRVADFVAPVVRLIRDAHERERWERAALEFARERFPASRVWREMETCLDDWRARSAQRQAA